jgi:trehalose 2-sulfotransferase
MKLFKSTISSQLSTMGSHENAISDYFGAKSRFVGDAPVFSSPLYIMAFTNRCGSNLLGDYLRQTGCIGGFHESLNYDTVLRFSKEKGIQSFPAYFEMLYDKQSVRGNWGVKASWDQILMLSRLRILDMFSGVKIIHIRRNNVLSQAVSHCIAGQTKQWTSKQKGLEVEPEYDFESINTIIGNINDANVMISLILQALSGKHASVTYEILERSPQDAVTTALKRVGLPCANFDLGEPRIAKQADERNVSFINRYKADLRARIASAK